MYRYKDMTAAKSSALGIAIAEGQHPKVIERLYQMAKERFLKDYPRCTQE